ncbi:Hypothetical protein A7982_03463 [Minicystis rosea]|nr:Hypothetical protein A7982_03463 [Minicystis rosea]
MELPTGWLTPGSNEKLWGRGGTYKTIAYEALPPLQGPLDGSFDWLAAAPSRADGMELSRDEDGDEVEAAPIATLLAKRIAEAKRAKLVIPPSFTRFMTDETLFTRVPSCTACYWELGPCLVRIPDHDGPERLLRFMNDQQACALWYLLLLPDGDHRVVFARPDLSEEANEDPFQKDVVPRDVTLCAPSFEAFIKRFWLENTLWYAVRTGAALTGELSDYIEAADRSIASGLVQR